MKKMVTDRKTALGLEPPGVRRTEFKSQSPQNSCHSYSILTGIVYFILEEDIKPLLKVHSTLPDIKVGNHSLT